MFRHKSSLPRRFCSTAYAARGAAMLVVAETAVLLQPRGADAMNSLMGGLRAGTLALALVGALPAHAAQAGDERGQASKQENAGVVAGVALGAVVAGPVGAVVGGGVGALLGDRYHRQAQARAALAQDLDKSEAERTRLTASIAQLDRTLQNADELGVDVSFRTDDAAVTAQAMPPLLKLGALAASMPGAQVRVAGYADPRGSDAWNDALSLRRAQSVADVLTLAGVTRERIVVEAHGRSESASAAGDLDGYAFDRRVTVRLQLPGSGEVARRD
jgi:outer membrane protein OmpA-like peptidoglycan-associated protein